MKRPKSLNRHCPFCNKHTEQKVSTAKKRAKGATHPLSRGSKNRAMRRGEWRGVGNLGKYSKPPKPKMVGKKLSKKTDFRYTCSACKKTHAQSSGFRAKKVELV
ncbi:50S ribosomal protein L44e [Candidatus Woesearchaeota archaeon]|jgi:large subunit ribosomal protein L44e|nr:50S ribosomal protein L44e [Candidatus Woesearchaeota archaeon]|tara:strand:+ start:789 stop:1100 length:312 start_codon:yes stop_codon:yes gene_type:complete